MTYLVWDLGQGPTGSAHRLHRVWSGDSASSVAPRCEVTASGGSMKAPFHRRLGETSEAKAAKKKKKKITWLSRTLHLAGELTVGVCVFADLRLLLKGFGSQDAVSFTVYSVKFVPHKSTFRLRYLLKPCVSVRSCSEISCSNPAGMWMSQWKQQPGLRISFIFTLAWPHPASMRNSFSPRAGDFSSLRKQEDVPHDWLKDPVIITNVPHRRSSGFASFFPPALTSFLSYWLAVKPLDTSSGGTAWWKTNKLANRKALSSAESLSAKQGGKKMKKRNNSQVKKASCCDRKSSLVMITTRGGKSTCILYLLSVNTQIFE